MLEIECYNCKHRFIANNDYDDIVEIPVAGGETVTASRGHKVDYICPKCNAQGTSTDNSAS
jgi:DNA-directed RNA polymerase subunit RPC12/RpoP